MRARDVDTGSGDVYDNPLKYGPLGSVLTKSIDILKQFEGSTNNLGGDIVNAIATLRPIAEPLWKLARFNFHVLDDITREARLNTLPLVTSALRVFDDIFSHDPFNDAQRM
ncbi:hypothetical protein BGZ52_010872, partial [Haplosporangium bisporale]